MAHIAAGAAIVGAGISIYGNYKANQAQAKAEEANGAFYKEQAEFARQAGVRELDLYDTESKQFLGNQISQIAKGGVTQSGSALLILADTRAQQFKESAAIADNSNAKVHEALLKAGASYDQAKRLKSTEATLLPAVGTALTTGSNLGLAMSRKN